MNSADLIPVNTRFGHNLLVIKDDYISQHIIRDGCYEGFILELLRFLLKKIKPGISLDIGANIGNHAVIIAEYSNKLWAFEPHPDLVEILSTNLSNNGKTNAQVSSFALGNQTSESTLHMSEDGNSGRSSLNANWSNGKTHQVEVKTIAGDAFIEQEALHPIDFIKLDVESFEYYVISGLSDTIKKDQPLVLMEWNSQEVKNQFTEHKIFDLLFKHYAMYSVVQLKDKQLFNRNLFSQLKRNVLKWKYSSNQWCLAPFKEEGNYDAILLIPDRFKIHLTGLQQMQTRENNIIHYEPINA